MSTLPVDIRGNLHGRSLCSLPFGGFCRRCFEPQARNSVSERSERQLPVDIRGNLHGRSASFAPLRGYLSTLPVDIRGNLHGRSLCSLPFGGFSPRCPRLWRLLQDASGSDLESLRLISTESIHRPICCGRVTNVAKRCQDHASKAPPQYPIPETKRLAYSPLTRRSCTHSACAHTGSGRSRCRDHASRRRANHS